MITSLIILTDSIYAHTNPFFGLAGIANDPNDNVPVKTGHLLDVETGADNRIPFIRAATNPPLFICNCANPGSRLGTGPISGVAYTPARIYPMIRPSLSGPSRLFIVFMAYSNRTDSLPADVATRNLAWFNAAYDYAASVGAALVGMTATVISRTGAGGFTTESARHTYNNTYLRNSSWRANNGRPIYLADYAGIPQLDDTNATDGWGTDGIHPPDAVLQLMTPPLRVTLNQIIAAHL